MSDFVLRKTYSLRWDGTNGAAIAALCDANQFDASTWSVLTETPTVLTLLRSNPGGILMVLATEPWVIIQRSQSMPIRLSDDQYANQMTDLEGMKTTEGWPADPAPVLTVGVGSAALPALILNGTTAPVITFDQAMPSADYVLKWRAVAGASVLSAITANGAPTKTATQVTVPLKATGISLAGVLLVEAYSLT